MCLRLSSVHIEHLQYDDSLCRLCLIPIRYMLVQQYSTTVHTIYNTYFCIFRCQQVTHMGDLTEIGVEEGQADSIIVVSIEE